MWTLSCSNIYSRWATIDTPCIPVTPRGSSSLISSSNDNILFFCIGLLALCYSSISSIYSISTTWQSVPFNSKYSKDLLSSIADDNNYPPFLPKSFHLKSIDNSVVFYLKAFANPSIKSPVSLLLLIPKCWIDLF